MRKVVLPLMLCMAVHSALADTVFLTNGERLDGRILSESDTEVVIEVQVSPTIRDERKIPRSDVASVEKEAPSEIAYRNIAGFRPGPGIRTPEWYEAAISALESFLSQYPSSPRAQEIRKNLDALTAERRKFEAGEVKFAGRWMLPEEAELHRPDVEANKLFIEMQRLAEAGDHVAALNTFGSIEKQAAGSRIYPDAIELALRVMPVLQREVERRMQTLKAELQERDLGVARAAEPEKSQMIAAIKAEDAREEALLAAAEKARLKWKPLLPRNEKSLTALKTVIPQETKRLSALPLAKMKAAVETMDRGIAARDAHDTAKAEKLFAEAAALWPGLKSVAVWQGKVKLAASPAPKKPAAPTPIPLPTSTPEQLGAVASPAPTRHGTVPASPAPMASPAPGAATSPVQATTPRTTAAVITGEESPEEAPVIDNRPFLLRIPGALLIIAIAVIANIAISLVERRRLSAAVARTEGEEQA
jgi:hypothetical protein